MASETTSKQSELILRAGNSTALRAHREILPIVVARIQRDGTILDISDGAERLTGFSRNELLSSGFARKLVHTDDRQVVKQALRQVGLDGEASGQIQIIKKDGLARNIEYRAVASGDDFNFVIVDVASGGSLFNELPVRSRYDDAEPMLRNMALASSDRLSFLESSLSLFVRMARADAGHVLMGGDAESLVSVSFWIDDKFDSIEPVELDPDAWPELLASRVALITSEDSSTAENLLASIDCEQAVLVPFRSDNDHDGAFLLEWRTDATPWSTQDSRSLARLARLFETLWAWMEAEARHELTLTDLEDGLFNFSFDSDGHRRYALVTPQFEAIAGIAPPELLASQGATPNVEWSAVVHEEDEAVVEAHERQLLNDERSQVEYRIVRPDTGEVRWVRESATPSQTPTGKPVVGGLLSDITERKRAEVTLLQAKNAAEQASQTKTAFMATMSHEIRSPLGAIHGFAELINEEVRDAESKDLDLPPQISEFAGIIEENTTRVLHLVHNLFDLSRLESGALDLRRIPVDLHAAIDRVALQYRTEAEEKGLSFAFERADGDPMLMGDPERVEQIIEHLVSNAVKFTDEGTVNLSTRLRDEQVEFEVSDTGVGIAEEYLDELFEPFSQEDYRLNRAYDGSGLGLAITKKLLDGMNAEIQVDSTKGEGSRFLITFNQGETS